MTAKICAILKNQLMDLQMDPHINTEIQAFVLEYTLTFQALELTFSSSTPGANWR